MPWRMARLAIEEANKAQETSILWWQHVITWNFWEMGMDIIPRIYKRSALSIRGSPRLLIVKMVRFRVHGLFAYIACGGRIGGNFFFLTAGRTLAFRQRHNAMVD